MYTPNELYITAYVAKVIKHPVALVTGGARRVGKAVALHLAQAGYDIAFTYLSSQSDAARLTKAIQARGRHALAIRADLTQPAPAVRQIRKQFGNYFTRLDVLVNNASLFLPGTEAMAELWAIHVESPLRLSETFRKHLKQSRGHVINMLDIQAEKPVPQYLAYCATKAALWNLTLGLARQMAPHVTVNGIAPGVVAWPADMPRDAQRKYLRRVPLGREGTPEDVANAVLFLCTGGTYMTGQILRLDGGRSLT